jgi:hypothetical protein
MYLQILEDFIQLSISKQFPYPRFFLLIHIYFHFLTFLGGFESAGRGLSPFPFTLGVC